MLINNIDITTYNARLLNRQIATAPIKSNTDWLDALNSGILLSQKHDYRVMRLTFLITAESEDEAYKLISKLTDNITKCNIKFDDISYVFPCLLEGTEFPERLQNSVFKVVFTLKNDYAIGDEVTEEFDLTPVDATPYTIEYYRHWATVGAYTECYDTEVQGPVVTETVWLPNQYTITEEIEDWPHFFLGIGIDLNKYKQPNELNGFVDVSDAEYSEEAARAFLKEHKILKIYYNRFSEDGYSDFPIENYPNRIWTVDNSNKKYIQLPFGQGWLPGDVDFYVYGRYYAFVERGNGSLLGTHVDENKGALSFQLNNENAQILFDDKQITGTDWEVFKTDSVKGGRFIIETLEPISSTPQRRYGFFGSFGPEAQPNTVAFMFNGVTLDRVLANTDKPLEANFRIMSGAYGAALCADLSRAVIVHQGQVVADLIPIDGSVANGFFNNYDAGMYDMVNMKFYPWTDGEQTGSQPEALMPIPAGKPGPTPPKPIEKYTLTVNGGTIVSPEGTEFREGTSVTIKADAASKNKEFDQWTLESGSIVADLTKAEITFNMPASDVTITSTYKDIAKAVYFYKGCKDGNAIKAADDAAGGINKGATQIYCSAPVHGEYSSAEARNPAAFETNLAFVYSLQEPYGESTQWNVGNSNKTFMSAFTMTKQGSTPDGRAYIVFDCQRGTSTSGGSYTIDFETQSKEVLAQLTFDLKSA